MEHLEVLVPTVVVPLTLMAIYGVLWPEPSRSMRTRRKQRASAAASSFDRKLVSAKRFLINLREEVQHG